MCRCHFTLYTFGRDYINVFFILPFDFVNFVFSYEFCLISVKDNYVLLIGHELFEMINTMGRSCYELIMILILQKLAF